MFQFLRVTAKNKDTSINSAADPGEGEQTMAFLIAERTCLIRVTPILFPKPPFPLTSPC